MKKTTRTRTALVTLAAPLLALSVLGGALAPAQAADPQPGAPALSETPLTHEQQVKVDALHVAAREAADQFAQKAKVDALLTAAREAAQAFALRTAATEAAQAYTGGNH